MLIKERCLGIRCPRSLKPLSAKGNEAKTDGSAENVRPCEARKFSQYKLSPARSSRNGVKLPRYALSPLKALPKPSTRIKTMLGGLVESTLKNSPNTSGVSSVLKNGYSDLTYLNTGALSGRLS